MKLTYKYIKNYIESFNYKLISKKYINSSTHLLIKCNNGHEYKVTWNNFQRGKRCPECYNKIRYKNNILSQKTVKEYIESFGYKLLSVYKGYKKKIKVECPNNHIYNVIFSNFKAGQRCQQCYTDSISEDGNPNWRGGSGVAWYNTHAPQLNWCEEVRRDPDNKDLLQVRCTNSSCRKWFNPSRREVCSRRRSLNGEARGENRFYCSDKCKNECPIFYQKLYLKGFTPNHDRINQKDWSDLVKERDNYTCQICGSKEDIVAHHYEGIYCNPLESADIDTGITLCKKCHLKVHSEEGCRYTDLMRRKNETDD